MSDSRQGNKARDLGMRPSYVEAKDKGEGPVLREEAPAGKQGGPRRKRGGENFEGGPTRGVRTGDRLGDWADQQARKEREKTMRLSKEYLLREAQQGGSTLVARDSGTSGSRQGRREKPQTIPEQDGT